MSAAAYSQESQLGLTAAELVILRQEREIVAAQQGARQAQSRTDRSTMAEPRGRGTGRNSQSSSIRGNSAASSSAARRVPLDSTSLGRIQNAINGVMVTVAGRIQQLEMEMDASQKAAQRAAAASMAAADAEIAKARRILKEIDRLEAIMEEHEVLFAHIKAMRKKCEAMGSRLDRITSQHPEPRRR